MKQALAITVISLSLCSFAANSKLYKWVDDKGQVNYSQTKPTDFKASEVNAPPPPPSDAPDLNKPFADQIRSKSTSKNGSSSSSSTGNNSNDDACETARKNLSALQNNARIKYKDTKGETVIMPDDVKKQKVEESQEQVKQFCK